MKTFAEATVRRKSSPDRWVRVRLSVDNASTQRVIRRAKTFQWTSLFAIKGVHPHQNGEALVAAASSGVGYQMGGNDWPLLIVELEVIEARIDFEAFENHATAVAAGLAFCRALGVPLRADDESDAWEEVP